MFFIFDFFIFFLIFCFFSLFLRPHLNIVEAQLSLCTDVDSQCYTSLTLVLSFLVGTAPLSPSNKQAWFLNVDPRQFDEMRKSASQRVIKDRQDHRRAIHSGRKGLRVSDRAPRSTVNSSRIWTPSETKRSSLGGTTMF